MIIIGLISPHPKGGYWEARKMALLEALGIWASEKALIDTV